jgi:hypothetical protein
MLTSAPGPEALLFLVSVLRAPFPKPMECHNVKPQHHSPRLSVKTTGT